MTAPHQYPVVAYNLAKGEATRFRVWTAIKGLGISAESKHRKALSEATGINLVSVGRAMRAIREGWEPKGDGK